MCHLNVCQDISSILLSSDLTIKYVLTCEVYVLNEMASFQRIHNEEDEYGKASADIS